MYEWLAMLIRLLECDGRRALEKMVPGHGLVTWSRRKLEQYAAEVVRTHRANGPTLQLQLRFPPLRRRSRLCIRCLNPFPCGSLTWAEHVLSSGVPEWTRTI